MRRPEARQEFDDDQEIITLSPEVKRFSGEGGRQTFAVDVKASFSPHPDSQVGSTALKLFHNIRWLE